MRTAFVLAGGGSFGAIEVGMLGALLAEGIALDLVVGSSVGAINDMYLACDPTVNGIRRLADIWHGPRSRLCSRGGHSSPDGDAPRDGRKQHRTLLGTSGHAYGFI